MSDEVTRLAEEAQSERSVSREHYDWMVGDRDAWQQRAGGFERAAQQMTAALHRLTAERDAALADLAKVREERDIAEHEDNTLREERDAAERNRKEVAECNSRLAIHLNDMRAERDAARADLDTLTMERDRAQSHLQSIIRKADHFVTERDAAQDETHKLREQYAKLYSEAEGLRADLLASASYHQELAIERKRHIELSEDYDTQALMITTLQDALKRTENALKVAQAKHIDERLPGVLASISKLASEAEELLP